MEKKKHNFRFVIDNEIASEFKQAIKKQGYQTVAEWFREKIREELYEGKS